MCGAHPSPLRPPPHGLNNLALPTASLSDPLYRVHPPTPTPFRLSSEEGRFSGAHSPHPVFYGGVTRLAAFTETCVVIVPSPSSTGITFAASGSFVDSRFVTSVVPTRPLTVVDLFSPQLLSIGATHDINTTHDYPTTQLWAAAFHDHPAQPDGILYESNLCGEGCLALFGRAIPILTVHSSGPLSMDEVESHLSELGIALI